MNKLSASLSKLKAVMDPERRMAIVSKVKANGGDAISTVKDMLAKSKGELESIHKQTGVQLPELEIASKQLEEPKKDEAKPTKAASIEAPKQRDLMAELQTLLTEKRAEAPKDAMPGHASSTVPTPTGAESRAAAHPDVGNSNYGRQATALPTPDQGNDNYGAQSGTTTPSAAQSAAQPEVAPQASNSTTPPTAVAPQPNTDAQAAQTAETAAYQADNQVSQPAKTNTSEAPVDQNGNASGFNSDPNRTTGVFAGGKAMTHGQLQSGAQSIQQTTAQNLQPAQSINSKPATPGLSDSQQGLNDETQAANAGGVLAATSSLPGQQIGTVPQNVAPQTATAQTVAASQPAQAATPTGKVNPQNDLPQQSTAANQLNSLAASGNAPGGLADTMARPYTPATQRTGIRGMMDRTFGDPRARTRAQGILTADTNNLRPEEYLSRGRMHQQQPAVDRIRAGMQTPENAPAGMEVSASVLIGPLLKQAEEQSVGHIGNSDQDNERMGTTEMKPADEQAVLEFVRTNPNLDDEKFHEFIQSRSIDPVDADAVVNRHFNSTVSKQANLQQAFAEGVLEVCKTAGVQPVDVMTITGVIGNMLPEFSNSLQVVKAAFVTPDKGHISSGWNPSEVGKSNNTPGPVTPSDGPTGNASHRFMVGMAGRNLKARGKNKTGVAPHPDDIFKSLGNQMAIQSVAGKVQQPA